MDKIKKNDIVVRKSYGKDVIFKVINIIEKKEEKVAILKGITERIQADSSIDDLEIVTKSYVTQIIKNWESRIKVRAKREKQDISQNTGIKILLNNNKSKTGRILHLDADSCLDNKNNKKG